MNKQPELIIDRYRNKCWMLYGEYHNEDGPAIIFPSGAKKWLLNGKYHRIDGPAVIYSNGNKEWYLNDEEYTYEEWFSKLTSEQQYNYLWNLDE